MQDQAHHALLIIKVDKQFGSSPALSGEIKGCRKCLEQAITTILLQNEDFKNLFNAAIRKANEIKARTQN